MSAHTPGPWKVTEPASPRHERTVQDAAGDVIAGVWGDDAEAIANARLIAAVPELLAALEEFETADCDSCDGMGKDSRDARNACRICGGFGLVITGGDPHVLRAAIAKAKGA